VLLDAASWQLPLFRAHLPLVLLLPFCILAPYSSLSSSLMTSVNVQASEFAARYVDPEGVPIANAGQALLGAGSASASSSNAPKFGTLIPNRIFVGGIPSNASVSLSRLIFLYGLMLLTLHRQRLVLHHCFSRYKVSSLVLIIFHLVIYGLVLIGSPKRIFNDQHLKGSFFCILDRPRTPTIVF
ncbi:Protein boule, partial [Taenia solium]